MEITDALPFPIGCVHSSYSATCPASVGDGAWELRLTTVNCGDMPFRGKSTLPYLCVVVPCADSHKLRTAAQSKKNL